MSIGWDLLRFRVSSRLRRTMMDANELQKKSLRPVLCLLGAAALLVTLTHAASAHDEEGWYRPREHDWHSGWHHDWHSGPHYGQHSGFHWDPYYGWHYGRHNGPHEAMTIGIVARTMTGMVAITTTRT
ncbi:hypothetical protein EAS62_25655 [Bradyrhizobium zhanjiangense]|uniref:Sulfur globule protein n=2 Tax=Bradyrhizobium zhanjiangense TaxID=1325107 RepID=A0ABY0DHB1_9BRAD|nr:hypothetical protein EAS62_25655 [Bradyrhizobium zhanjiangense]